jgi:cytochrome c556
MMRKTMGLLIAASLLTSAIAAAAPAASKDARKLVRLPAQMRTHMLSNMRDHLVALHEIQAALAAGKLEQAADVAESRIGMSSLASHGGAHMAPYMPQPMQDIGTEMHHAASRLARSAHEGDVKKALTDLSAVTQQCVACHAAYRVH